MENKQLEKKYSITFGGVSAICKFNQRILLDDKVLECGCVLNKGAACSEETCSIISFSAPDKTEEKKEFQTKAKTPHKVKHYKNRKKKRKLEGR